MSFVASRASPRHVPFTRTAIVSALFLSIASPTSARDLPFDRLFANPSLAGPVPRSPKLSPDGRYVTVLRNRADDKGRSDLWATDTATGQSRMLVDSSVVGPKTIGSYSWAPDGRSILMPLGGDIYVATLDGNARRLTQTPEAEVDAQMSQTGRYVSFLRDQNLFVIEVADGKERQLTTDGGGTLSWGSAEYIARMGMDRFVGHWWSPDERYLAVARVDESKVKVLTHAEVGSDGSKYVEQRYPVAGSTNALVELHVMTPDGSRRVKADLGPDPDYYLARVDWAADGKSLLVQRQSRDQKRVDLLRVDPESGRSSLLFSESSPTWVNLNDNLRPLKDGSLIWSSERSGFSHLYHWSGGKWRQLTSGKWEVSKVIAVDEAARRIYFTGTLDNPDADQLYRVSYAKPSGPVRVTETGWDNKVEVDDRGTRILVVRSNPKQPTQAYLADISGKRLTWVEENLIGADHPYAPYLDSHVVPAFGTLPAADGTPIPYKIMMPRLEPGKRYPVFVQVYGGPTGAQVSQEWQSFVSQYLVDKGWIVFSVDNRGTPHRGRAFADQLYMKLGTVEVADQLAGVEWLKRQPFVDASKIAVHGWSYGGYMVLKLLEAAPGAYAAGISGAPVTQWERYQAHYTERYLGSPAVNPSAYEAAGVLKDAGKIADPLLLVHGMADDNVLLEHNSAMVTELQKRRKPFELMLYPNATHSPGQSVAHLWKTIEDFLERRVLNRTDAARN